jgi:hypothetical protein
LQEQVNPYNYRQEYGLSAFDIGQNVVFSYNYELPLEKLFHATNRLAQGWAVSGITRFATGLPVTFASLGDNALMGVGNNGVNGIGIDLPDVVAGNLEINHDPRKGQPYFDTSLFSPNALGTQGNASRRPFFGPGMDNWDIALHKTTKFAEARTLDGYVTQAAAPRIAQAAAKFMF